MPTRIVLKEAAPSRRRESEKQAGLVQRSNVDDEEPSSFVAADKSNQNQNNQPQQSTTQHLTRSENVAIRRAVAKTSSDPRTSTRNNTSSSVSTKKFRSSILEALSVRSEAEKLQEYEDNANVVRLSSDDIRASPRLLGYLFAMIASAVMLVSVVQFYRETPNVMPTNEVAVDDTRYFVIPQGVVLYWKLWGSMAVASLGCLINLLTVLAHFDTFCCHSFWIYFFRDGSLAERNYLLLLLLFWAIGLHLCTSSLSVGELQANVFFTTWIAFASTLGNLSIWRESAGLPAVTDRINHHYRETTYNWMWTAFFSMIFAGAVTGLYFNRYNINAVNQGLNGKDLNISTSDWIKVLCIVWTEVAICATAIAFNEWFFKTHYLPCRCRQKREHYRCVFGWRQLEGLVIIATLGGKFYIILEYTGVDAIINGLSNAYFGIWGSFFNSVFALGTWLNENKNTTYIVREGDEEDE